MQLIEVSGSNYEIGYKLGKHFKNYLNNVIKKYDEKIKYKNIYEDVKNMENKLKREFPQYLDEIYGRADGACLSRDSILLMFFPEIFKQPDGCTTLIMRNKDNKYLFSHNEDDRNYNSDNIALVKYNYEDYWIIGYTMAEKLMGSSFAFNSYGMIFSSNYIYDTVVDLNNISRYIMVRSIMNSKNIEEVINKFEKHPVASAFSLNILDLKTNEAINVEKDIKDFYITKIEDRYARSNHFLSKKENLPDIPKSSNFRYNKTNELLNKLSIDSVKLYDLESILNYETSDYYESIFKSPEKYNDKSVTVANFSYDADFSKIIVKDFLDNTKLEFDIYKLISMNESN